MNGRHGRKLGTPILTTKPSSILHLHDSRFLYDVCMAFYRLVLVEYSRKHLPHILYSPDIHVHPRTLQPVTVLTVSLSLFASLIPRLSDDE